MTKYVLILALLAFLSWVSWLVYASESYKEPCQQICKSRGYLYARVSANMPPRCNCINTEMVPLP